MENAGAVSSGFFVESLSPFHIVNALRLFSPVALIAI